MRLSTQKNIGNNLKCLRVNNNLSQAAMSELAGMTRSLYAQYELGNRTPDAEALFEIASHFGLNMSLFFEPNATKFIGELSSTKVCSESSRQLMELFDNLSPFSKGRLLERAEQLLEWDIFKEKNYNSMMQIRDAK